MVRAVEPLYVPENVRVASVAVRFARFCPRAIPEMVEFWSWLFPIVDVATIEPLLFTAMSEFVRPRSARFVVVAFTEVRFGIVVEPVTRRVEFMVEDAVERKPPKNPRVVEVACSLVESFVNGNAKVRAAGKVVRQSPERQSVFVAKVVEVAFVVVAFTPVKFWRVVDPRAK